MSRFSSDITGKWDKGNKMSNMLKITIEWDGKVYHDEELISSTPSDINPGDKTLPLMGESAERMMIEILGKIVTASQV